MAATGPLDGEALFERAACGLMVTSADGRVLRVNQTLCRWLGYEPGQLVGKRKLQELLTMGGRIFHQTHWLPLLQLQGSVAEVKLEVVHSDGRSIPMVMNAVRHEQDGHTLHDVAAFVAEDRHLYERQLVAARRRAEELLDMEQQAQAALAVVQAELTRQHVAAEDRANFAEQMVGIVSHDLRNPLSAIQMGVSLLARTGMTPAQLRILDRVTNSTGRASRLIADLLDFTQARLTQGLRVSAKEIDLESTLAGYVDELTLSFPSRLLEYRHAGTGPCEADADRLMQMVGNLVSNAMNYGSPDQPVVVRSTIEAERFLVSVHNGGTPIATDLLPTLFEPMTRGHNPTASGRSVGLGLYIVREIVRAHAGDVGVVSTAHDGTTFSADFPRRASRC